MGKLAGLSKEQRSTLDRLRAVRGIDRFYLAGGSAIAVHLHHRRSLDLDLFSAAPEVDLSAVSESVRAVVPEMKVFSLSDAALRVRIGQIPVDLVRYPYPPLDPPALDPLAFPVAGLRDLGAMKLAAIARRGLRRDFWDLHAIIGSGLSLAEIAAAYLAKFGVAEADLYHVLRALTYHDDAERDPVAPTGLTYRKWAQIKAFFYAEAPKLLTPQSR
jgi:hypothetical protein